MTRTKPLVFIPKSWALLKKQRYPTGQHRWLTVVSPDARDGVELLLEPMGFEPALVYQKALFTAGIPCTVFGIADIQKEYERLLQLGVVFKTPPTAMGPVTIAVFEDTCGNLVQMAQLH